MTCPASLSARTCLLLPFLFLLGSSCAFRCGPTQDEDLAQLAVARTVDLDLPDPLEDYLPVFTRRSKGSGLGGGTSTRLRVGRSVDELTSSGLAVAPEFGSPRGAFRDEVQKALAGIEIDALSLGQDYLRMLTKGTGRDLRWQLEPFNAIITDDEEPGLGEPVEFGSDGFFPMANWAFLAFVDEAPSTPVLRAIYWGTPIQQFATKGLRKLPRDAPDYGLRLVELELDGLDRISGLDLTSAHLVRSFPAPRDGEAASAEARRTRQVQLTDEEYALVLRPFEDSTNVLRVYFSVTPDEANFERIAPRLAPGHGDVDGWRSGATIFSIPFFFPKLSASDRLDPLVGPIQVEFTPGHVLAPHFGFPANADIDALAVDSLHGIVMASLADDPRTRNVNEEGPAGLYAWAMVPGSSGWTPFHPAEPDCPTKGDAKNLFRYLPSPIHHWGGDPLDEVVGKLIEASAAPVASGLQLDEPKPIRPTTGCGDDPARQRVSPLPPPRGTTHR